MNDIYQRVTVIAHHYKSYKQPTLSLKIKRVRWRWQQWMILSFFTRFELSLIIFEEKVHPVFFFFAYFGVSLSNKTSFFVFSLRLTRSSQSLPTLSASLLSLSSSLPLLSLSSLSSLSLSAVIKTDFGIGASHHGRRKKFFPTKPSQKKKKKKE